MEFKIDCESKETVFKSLCNGFSCSSELLEKTLLALDIEKLYQENVSHIDVPPESYLYEYAVKQLGNHKPLKTVSWFHLTRTTKKNEFADGIIPLGDILGRIWSLLLDAPTSEMIKNNLKVLRDSEVLNFHYDLKHNDQIHWGPYAVLVRDTAFNASNLSQHDYLGMPEIIEDICNGYKEKFGESIIEIYESSLFPKIVKFTSCKQIGNGCIEAALNYAYEAARDNPPSSNCVLCFDGEGIKVEAESIISVTTIV